jgi:diguanylate cyclase (GGDEF)-like protein
MWAFILLGIGQSIGVLYGSQSGGLEAIIVILAYLLFMVTFLQKIYVPLFARLQEAEAKLQDLNMTVNYEVKKRVIEIERHNEHLINMSQLDSMTGVLNKQAAINAIKSLTERKTSRGFTIILFDIDNFKKINDSKGHLVGDKYLKTVSAIARESCRKVDRVGRYGGDEFIIILPNTNLSEGMYAADRFRQKVQDNDANITISAGLAHFPEDGNSVKDLIDYADQGLYKSKERGRNVVSHLKSLKELDSLNKLKE